MLRALDGVRKGENPPIKRNEWTSTLTSSREVYLKKGLKNGINLVNALDQLIKCVDELADYQERKKSIVQQKRLKNCYNNLIEISSKVEGGLKNIADFPSDIIKKYAKEKNLSFIEEKISDKSNLFFKNRYIKAIKYIIVVIILGYITNLLFEWNIHGLLWNIIKSYLK